MQSSEAIVTSSRWKLGCGIGAVLLLAGWAAFHAWYGQEVPAWEVTEQPLVQSVVATGRVYTPSRVRIGTELTGIVKSRVVKEGDSVSIGQTLLELDDGVHVARVREAEAALQRLVDTERPQAAAALQQAEEQLAQARREATRRRGLVAARAIAREDLEQAEQAVLVAQISVEQARLRVASLAPGQSEVAIARERLAAARADLDKTVIRSPIHGRVLARSVEPGDVVRPGDVLLEIARIDDIEIQIPLDEINLGFVALGQHAVCIAEAFPDRPFPARVTFIAPGVDPQRGTVDVRLTPLEAVDFLVPDMTVSASIETARREHALVIPDDALIRTGASGTHVLLVRDGKAELQAVKLGLRGTARSEVVDGLRAGDWVLRDTTVEPGTRVRPVTQPD